MSNPYELTPHIAIASAPILGDMSIFIERIGGWPRISVIFAFIAYMVVALAACLVPKPKTRSERSKNANQVFLLEYHPIETSPKRPLRAALQTSV